MGVAYFVGPSTGLPACLRVVSSVLPLTLLLSCFEPLDEWPAADLTASPPLAKAADMAAPLVVEDRSGAMRGRPSRWCEESGYGGARQAG